MFSFLKRKKADAPARQDNPPPERCDPEPLPSVARPVRPLTPEERQAEGIRREIEKTKAHMARLDSPDYLSIYEGSDNYDEMKEDIPRSRDYDILKIAELQYRLDCDLEGYILAVEAVWHREGGTLACIRDRYALVDLYIKAERFDDALSELDIILEVSPRDSWKVEGKREEIRRKANS